MVKALLPETKLDGLMDIHEASSFLEVHPQSVRVLVRKGKLQAIRLNGSRLVFETERLTRFKETYRPKKPKVRREDG